MHFPKKIIMMSAVFFLFLIQISCSTGGGCAGLFKGDKGGVSVTVEKVRVVETSPVTTVTGKLIPNDRADISYLNDVKIGDVFVGVGSHVNEGEALFRIAEEDLAHELNVARAKKTELDAVIEKNNNLMKGRENLAEEGKVDQEEVSRLEKEITLKEAELERVKAEIQKFTYNLEHVTVASPATGIVIEKNISPGSVAKAEKVLLSIINVDPIIVSFPMNAGESSRITVDMPIKVFVNEVPNKEFTGIVTYINPELQRVGNTFNVWASIPNPNGLLKAGMTASTEFESDTTKHSYIVPLSAVFSRTSRPYVFKVDKGTAHKIEIVIGAVAGQQVEVVRGLGAGDIVVAKGGEDLFDGASVDIWR